MGWDWIWIGDISVKKNKWVVKFVPYLFYLKILIFTVCTYNCTLDFYLVSEIEWELERERDN